VPVLFSAGLQEPSIPLVEVVGKAESASPEQIAATGLKFGVMIGFTVIVKVAAEAHCPPFGVKL